MSECVCVCEYCQLTVSCLLQYAFEHGEWGRMSARDRAKIMYR